MESFVAYGMLAYLAVLWLRSWEARVAAVCGAALLVVLIGFSRMYLGVHYFSDVIAGYAAGGVWLSALITGAETMRRGSKSEIKSGGPGTTEHTFYGAVLLSPTSVSSQTLSTEDLAISS